MNKKSDFICSFKQKLTYEDFINFNKYKIKTFDTNPINTNLLNKLKLIFTFIWILLLIITFTAKSDLTLQIVFVLIILFFILMFSAKKLPYLIAKFHSIKSTESLFSLYKDYILYTPVNTEKNFGEFKFLTETITEIILDANFCAIKFSSDVIILISLFNNSSQVETMLNYFKTHYSDKIVINKNS